MKHICCVLVAVFLSIFPCYSNHCVIFPRFLVVNHALTFFDVYNVFFVFFRDVSHQIIFHDLPSFLLVCVYPVIPCAKIFPCGTAAFISFSLAFAACRQSGAASLVIRKQWIFAIVNFFHNPAPFSPVYPPGSGWFIIKSCCIHDQAFQSLMLTMIESHNGLMF